MFSTMCEWLQIQGINSFQMSGRSFNFFPLFVIHPLNTKLVDKCFDNVQITHRTKVLAHPFLHFDCHGGHWWPDRLTSYNCKN